MPSYQARKDFARRLDETTAIRGFQPRPVWVVRSLGDSGLHATEPEVLLGRQALKRMRADGTSPGLQDTPRLRAILRRCFLLAGGDQEPQNLVDRNYATAVALDLLQELSLNEGSSIMAKCVIKTMKELADEVVSDLDLQHPFVGLHQVVHRMRPASPVLLDLGKHERPGSRETIRNHLSSVDARCDSMTEFTREELSQLLRQKSFDAARAGNQPLRVMVFGVSSILRSTLTSPATPVEVTAVRGVVNDLVDYRPSAIPGLPAGWLLERDPFQDNPRATSADIKQWLAILNPSMILFGTPLMLAKGVLAERGIGRFLGPAAELGIDRWCVAGPYKYLFVGRYHRPHDLEAMAARKYFELVDYRSLTSVLCG